MSLGIGLCARIVRDVCKSRIHDRRDYRDFRLVSSIVIFGNWCNSLTAVIISKICTI